MIKLNVMLHADGEGELWCEQRNENGELVGYGRKALERIRDGGALSPEEWESLYQQNPIPKGGGLLKEEWWNVTELSAFAKPKAAIITVDSAFKEGIRNDYTVFALWIKGLDGHAYLRDIWRGRKEATQVQLELHKFYAKHKSLRPKILIEDKASGQTIIKAMRQTWLHRDIQTGVVTEYAPLPIIAYSIPRGMGGKEQALQARAEAVSQWAQAGLVHVLKDAPWLRDWLFEHNRAPKGAHDDQVITTIMMLEHWYANGRGEIPASGPMTDKDVERMQASPRGLPKGNFAKRQRELYEDRELQGWIEQGFSPKTGEWTKPKGV
jgi:phage terminase large subunit-like protein